MSTDVRSRVMRRTSRPKATNHRRPSSRQQGADGGRNADAQPKETLDHGPHSAESKVSARPTERDGVLAHAPCATAGLKCRSMKEWNKDANSRHSGCHSDHLLYPSVFTNKMVRTHQLHRVDSVAPKGEGSDQRRLFRSLALSPYSGRFASTAVHKPLRAIGRSNGLPVWWFATHWFHRGVRNSKATTSGRCWCRRG